jgi:beta-glucanase (GH16 family)
MWPAFWMLGTAGRWPVDGELDIMEARGRAPTAVEGTAHWGNNNANYGKSTTLPGGTDFTSWHVYTLEWNATTRSWSVDDGAPYVTMTPIDACFTKSFYFILNLAIGGSFDGNKAPPAGMTAQQMLVDWVRVYQLP